MTAPSNVSSWPSRLAWATLIATIPLIAMGGLITTLRAGMAEDGWLQPEGHWLWLYPWEKRMASLGRFVEHHHRELGTLVGLLSILTVVATIWTKSGKAAITAAVIGLFAVSFQGVLGAARIDVNAPQLAFLHGVLAQVVFGILTAVAILLSVRWGDFPELPWANLPKLKGLATLLLVALVTQITLGGWYRHGHGHTAITLHGFMAIAVVVVGLKLSGRLKAASQAPELPSGSGAVLRKAALLVTGFLHLQWILGAIALTALFAFSDGMAGENISNSEIVFSTLHVTVGAMLTASIVNAFLWARRVDETQAQKDSAGGFSPVRSAEQP